VKKRYLIASLCAGMAALAFLGPAAAKPDGNGGTAGVTDPAILALITNDEVFATIDLAPLLSPPGGPPSQHYGPYEDSTSPDSGTCGNNWAEDIFDRHFHVKSNHDGTFTIVEQFKNGSFLTNDGASPGACQLDGSPGGLIRAGVTGTMHGYLIISDVGAQTSTDPSCIAGMPSAPCTTGGFLATHFMCGTGCNVSTFAFEYAAGDQGLLEHHWKNASDDRGGNNGDIRSG
jgi:hypothetical protein